MGFKDFTSNIGTTSKEERVANEAHRQAAEALAWANRTHYVTTVTTKVAWGSSRGSDVEKEVDFAYAKGFRLQAMTSCYAEKVGVNTLIHTLVFERQAETS